MVDTAAKSKPKTTKKTRSPRAYPAFHEMISDAIISLKERTGSSQYAITKFLEEKHQKQLPANFRKLLLLQLKKFVASGKLVKVKNSFKLPSARSAPPKKPEPVATKAKTATKKIAPKATKATPKATKAMPKAKAAVKPKKTVAKPAKVAKTAKVTSPGKKKAVAAKPKKAVTVKKVKSVKSPAGKKAVAKKAKK